MEKRIWKKLFFFLVGITSNLYICITVFLTPKFYSILWSDKMSFITNSGPKVIWANIAQGKIVLKSKEEKDGYVARVNKLGNTVYEKFFEGFAGQLASIRMQDGEYGCQYIFSFKDGEDFVNISVGCDSKYANHLLLRLLSNQLDIKSQFEIRPYSFTTKEGEPRSGLNVYQNGLKIQPAYTNEELPQPEKVVIKKKLTYNWTPVTDFLEERMKTVLLPQLESTLPFIKNDTEHKDNSSFIEKDIFDLDIE